MVLSRVKDTTSAANTNSVESSFSELEIGVSRPLKKIITTREPLPHTYSRIHDDTEAYGGNKNFDYKRKEKRKISSNHPTTDLAHSTLKRAIREAAEHRFKEEECSRQ